MGPVSFFRPPPAQKQFFNLAPTVLTKNNRLGQWFRNIKKIKLIFFQWPTRGVCIDRGYLGRPKFRGDIITPADAKTPTVLTCATSFKFQLCNHTSPGTQMLWFPGSFLRSLQNKRLQIASWHRLWLELGRYLIAFEPLTFVLD